MGQFGIYAVGAAGGRLAISPIPGRGGSFEEDMQRLLDWGPQLVLSMTTAHEMGATGAAQMPYRLARAGVRWLHLPVEDFGAPDGETAAYWPQAAAGARAVLTTGGRVLIHCFGGHGRSGMAALALLVDLGEDPGDALARLRQARPGAVETGAQQAWATKRTTDRP